MKKITYKYARFLLLLCMAAMLLPACEKDDMNPPVITEVRNYAAAPEDTVITSLRDGQWVVLQGSNLGGVTEVYFAGIPATINSTLFTDASIVVQVPSIPFQSVSMEDLSKITIVSEGGASTFTIGFTIDPPEVTRISYEIPSEGDSVYIYGNNFFYVEDITFAGESISEYRLSADGTSVGFIAPALTQSGPVTVTTDAGTFTTVYNVNDVATGRMSDFDWDGKFSWEWWGGAELFTGDPDAGWPAYNPDFPGNEGMYLVLNTPVLNPDQGADWSHAIRIAAEQWLPVENLNDPVDSWVLKFEINIANKWNGGTLVIKAFKANDDDSDNNYRARYEPWRVSENKTTPYSTKGWQTVTIPLSSFLLDEGQGAPATKLTDLLGDAATKRLILYMHNYASSPTATGFKAAFDNFRVVKR